MLLSLLVNILHYCFSIIGVTVIVLGVVQAVKVVAGGIFDNQFSAHLYKQSRSILCQHILVGLEFMVASDVVLTVVAQQVQQLYGLALLVLIRTVLSYFLDKELKELEQ